VTKRSENQCEATFPEKKYGCSGRAAAADISQLNFTSWKHAQK